MAFVHVAPLPSPSRFVAPLRMWFQHASATDGSGAGAGAAPSQPPADADGCLPAVAALPAPPRTLAWDLVAPTDSVAVLVYHVDLQAYLAVRQFRPPVLLAEWARRQRRRSAPAVAAGAGSSSAAEAAAPATADGCDAATAPMPTDEELTALAGAGVGFTLELCGGLVDKPAGTASLREIAAAEVAEEMGYAVSPAALVPLFSFPEAVNLTGARLTAFYGAVAERDRCGPGGGLYGEGEAIEVVALPADPAALRALLRAAAAPAGEDDGTGDAAAVAATAAAVVAFAAPEPLSCDLQLALRVALADGLGLT